MTLNKNIMRVFLGIFLTALLCSCKSDAPPKNSQFADAGVYYDPSAPLISFTAKTRSEDNLPEFYLFDDNPEHLNPRFLADGEEPSSIAHFENLGKGVYTVFSYHHRGDSCSFDSELFFDAAFSSQNGAEIELLAVGINNSWDWNKAWADYTGVPVEMPEFYRTFDCICEGDCLCRGGSGGCKSDCPAIIRGEKRTPETELYDGLNIEIPLSDAPLFLSDLVGHISESGLNKFRTGGYNEPMWMMMKFRINSGSAAFDTLAYRDKDAAAENFAALKKGAFDNEPQYKGIAQNAPVVTAEFDVTLNDSVPNGAIAATVKNARVPSGCTIKNGTFATNVNTWRERYPIAAESDLMQFEYTDAEKENLYGKEQKVRSDVWRFDAFHTKLYTDGGFAERRRLEKFGAETGGRLVPNGEIADIKHPRGNEESTDEFYGAVACNLGNFGVTNRYVIHLENGGTEDRRFCFDIASTAGQVYRFRQTDSDGKEVYGDGGCYYMKKFDDDPAEDPSSHTNPKARLKAAKYSDKLSFFAKKNESYTVEIEVTTLTGCNAPTYITMSAE